jgi:hypothetical protein
MGSGVISRDNEERRGIRGGVTVAGQDTTRLRSRSGRQPVNAWADACAELLRARCADLHHRHLCSAVSMCRRRSELRAAGGASRWTVTRRTDPSVDEPPVAAARHHPPASALQVARPETVRGGQRLAERVLDAVDVMEPTPRQLPAEQVADSPMAWPSASRRPVCPRSSGPRPCIRTIETLPSEDRITGHRSPSHR